MSQIQLTMTLLICTVSIPLLVDGQCNPGSCLNGGTCLPGYKGKGFKCRCPNSDLLIYGPRCEWANRGFHPDSREFSQIQTFQSLAGHEFHKNELLITFEFIAAEFETQRSVKILTIDLPDATSRFLQYTKEATVRNEDSLKISVSDKEYNALHSTKAGNWTSVKLKFSMESENNTNVLSVSGSVSSVSGGKTFQQVFKGAEAIDFKSAFVDSVLTLGSFYGCFRFVRVNNKLVDLRNVSEYNYKFGEPPLDPTVANNFTSHFCFLTQKACISNPSQFRVFDANWSTKCGRNSRCDGSLDSNSSRAGISAQNCNCKCETGKRRLQEPWINDNKCLSKLDAKDECIRDMPILSTASANYNVSWTTKKSHGIRINLRIFSIEFSLLTKETNVQSVLMLKSFSIEIINGQLQFCCNQNGNKLYYNFPKIQVSDDIWHTVSVNVLHQQLTLMIDMEPQFYDIPAFDSEVEDTDCKLNIPNSCIKGLRVSDLYMPLNTTEIIEDGNDDKIVVEIDTGVSVGAECNFTLTGLTPEQPEKNTKTDDINNKSDDSNKKSDDSNKKSDDSNKKSDGSGTLRASWMAPIILSILVILLV